MRATTTVLGHTCSGLTRFQSRIAHNGEPEPDYPCRPVFDARGCVEGCDDTNEFADAMLKAREPQEALT